MSIENRTVEIRARKEIPRVPLHALIELQGDLKTLSAVNYDKLKNSMLKRGFFVPVFVWADTSESPVVSLRLLDGHQRVRTLRKMKEEGFTVPQEVPAVMIDAADEIEARDKLLAIVSQFGEVDKEGLYEFLIKGQLEPESIVTDFRMPEIDGKKFLEEFFEEESPEDEEADNAIPESPAAIAKAGQVYRLGRHRLMCGDSTSSADVARLMGGKRAALCLTDPPYNVNYGADENPAGWSNHRVERTILNDHMSADEFRDFCRRWIVSISATVHGCVYVFGHPGPDGRIMFGELDSALHCSTTCVWVKDQFVMSRGKYHNRYEPCWFGWTTDGKNFTDDRTLTNVWEFARPKKSDLHPTMKPVALFEKLLGDASKKGDVVLDLFGGSGTTIIACEKSGRAARVMELDPKYVDVIIARWEQYTGEKSELLEEIQ